MDGNLTRVAKRIEQAAAPEDVFGELAGSGAEQMANLRLAFRQIARVAHPDRYLERDEQSVAQAAFARLTGWLAQAEEKIRAGGYGATGALRTKRGVYYIEDAYSQDGVFNLYRARLEENGGERPVTLKIPRDVHDNDLAQNEARILQILMAGKAAGKLGAYLPGWVETFLLEDGGATRQVNVFERQPGWYSLEEVRAAYPRGVDPKDMAWIWRRLLVALGFAHVNGVIHGAVLPGNVFILPGQHGLRLENWAFAVRDPSSSGEIIAAIDAEHEDWYPDEARNSQPPACATDIAMSARCMIYLLGGDPVGRFVPAGREHPASGGMPARVPAALRMFLKSCILPGVRARPQDAWVLKEELDELLEKLWGPRKFHPFVMR
jgi:hypothetical protein